VLIAGGIGITPFVPMIAELQRRGERCELHYCARSPQDAAFRRKLMESANADSVHMYYTRTGTPERLGIASVLGRLNPDDHVYCCGPASMVNELLERTRDRDPSTVHVERFGAQGRRDTGPALILELERSARRVLVEAGETILEALRRAGVECDSSCEAGVCRSCSVRYLGGNPIHRDLVLSADERRKILLPCVSGCASDTLVLDL
jgi:vanillate O-demethylase ferredoxin subunit